MMTAEAACIIVESPTNSRCFSPRLFWGSDFRFSVWGFWGLDFQFAICGSWLEGSGFAFRVYDLGFGFEGRRWKIWAVGFVVQR